MSSVRDYEVCGASIGLRPGPWVRVQLPGLQALLSPDETALISVPVQARRADLLH